MTPHVGVFPFLILGSLRQTAQGGEALGEFVAKTETARLSIGRIAGRL